MANRILIRTLALTTLMFVGCASVAEEDVRLRYEAEIEVGFEAMLHAEDSEGGTSKAFQTGEFELEYAFSERLTGFVGLSFEGVRSDEDGQRLNTFELELEQIGVSFELGAMTLTIGKIEPRFGSAEDTAPGYFSADFVGDYGLEKAGGLMAGFELGKGVLTTTAFVTADANELSNFALQYENSSDETTYHFGASSVSQGPDGPHTQRGLTLGLAVQPRSNLELITELAGFQNWEGSSSDALFALLGASFSYGPATYSSTISGRRVSGGSTDHLLSIGWDWSLNERTTLTAGYSSGSDDGRHTSMFAIAAKVEFGN